MSTLKKRNGMGERHDDGMMKHEILIHGLGGCIVGRAQRRRNPHDFILAPRPPSQSEQGGTIHLNSPVPIQIR